MEVPSVRIMKSRPVRPVRPVRSHSERPLPTFARVASPPPPPLSQRVVYHRLRSPRLGRRSCSAALSTRPKAEPSAEARVARSSLPQSRRSSLTSLVVLTPILKSIPVPLRAPRSPVVSEEGSSPLHHASASDPALSVSTDCGAEEACSGVKAVEVEEAWHDGDRPATRTCPSDDARAGQEVAQAPKAALVEAAQKLTRRRHASPSAHATFWQLFWSAVGPAHVVPYLCLHDIAELSFTCHAALHGLFLCTSMWQSLAQDRFGVCLRHVEACFSTALCQGVLDPPRTYDSADLRRTDVGPIGAPPLASPHQRAASTSSVGLAATPECPETLRQGTVVVVAGGSVPSLPRLAASPDTSRVLATHKAAACAPASALWEPLTATSTTGVVVTPSLQPAQGPHPPLTLMARDTLQHRRRRSLFWRHLFQWLHHHRVQHFLRVHVDCRLELRDLASPPTAASVEAARQTLTEAIHILYQGGCAHAEHGARLAALLQQRAALTLAAAHMLAEVRTVPPSSPPLPDGGLCCAAEARRRARADLALASVLSPDDASLRVRLTELNSAQELSDNRAQHSQAVSPVERWVGGYNAADAARTAQSPLTLFAYLHAWLTALEERATGASSSPSSSSSLPALVTATKPDTVSARLYVISAVLLFLHTYEELHVVATHLLVKASKAVPRCGATGSDVARLLLQSWSEWVHAPAGAHSNAAGDLELATSRVPWRLQRGMDIVCEHWVSEWVLRRDARLPDMLDALREPSHFSTAEGAEPVEEEEEELLSTLLLSLHHRVLLLRRPSARATVPSHSTKRDAYTSSSTTRGRACPPWSAWDCALRYLLLTPLHGERAASLTYLAALYHPPLASHLQQCTCFLSDTPVPAALPMAAAAHRAGPAGTDDTDSPPLPVGTHGVLVAMRLLHAASALAPTNVAAHSTLAVLCLSLGDVAAAQHALALYLDRWTRLPLTHAHTEDHEVRPGADRARGDTALFRTARRAERVPGLCLVPAMVLELHSRCEGRQADLHACTRWASEAMRHDPRLSTPVRLRAATYMDRGLGERADGELAALVRVTMRIDDVALRLRFLLDVLLRAEVTSPAAVAGSGRGRRAGACAHDTPTSPVLWARVAELAGTLYALAVADGQLGSGDDGAPLTGPYAELLAHAQSAYRQHGRGPGARWGVEEMPADEICATTFLNVLLHGSHHESLV